MATYSNHEQRMLDQQSGAEMDKRGIGSGRIGPTMLSIAFEEYLALKTEHAALADALRGLVYQCSAAEVPMVQFGGDPTQIARAINRALGLLAKVKA